MAATFNVGEITVTNVHRDVMNRVEQWCFIFALGRFDWKRGGHLWLPDLGLIIRFPPGSLIMLPSCVLRHGNVDLVSYSDSVRYSFTQYTPAALFQWEEWGCRSKVDVEVSTRQEDLDLVKTMEARAPADLAAAAFAKWPTLKSLGL
jgi:hypothetical protein